VVRPVLEEAPRVSSANPHFAKNVYFTCIDDRLVKPHQKFINDIGGAFYVAIAGGGLTFVSELEAATAFKQVAASYQINQIDTVYLESHTGCGAYALAGAKFSGAAEELERLYTDLDQAARLVEKALLEAGAKLGEVTVHVQVVNLEGVVQPRP